MAEDIRVGSTRDDWKTPPRHLEKAYIVEGLFAKEKHAEN
jgi:hypothetical protein